MGNQNKAWSTAFLASCRKRLAVIGIAVGIATSLVPLPALAFSFEGAVWQQDNVGLACGQYSSGSWNQSTPALQSRPCVVTTHVTPGVASRADWQTTVGAASGWWYSASGGYLFIAYAQQSAPSYDKNQDMTEVDVADLGPIDPVRGTGKLAEAWYATYAAGSGYPSTNTTSSPYAALAPHYGTVNINVNASVPWCSRNQSGCPNSNAYQLESVVTHELGHEIGLAHPTLNQSVAPLAVMHCQVFKGETTVVTADDRQGALWMYSVPNPPGFPVGAPC